jgi:hypothetical protein
VASTAAMPSFRAATGAPETFAAVSFSLNRRTMTGCAVSAAFKAAAKLPTPPWTVCLQGRALALALVRQARREVPGAEVTCDHEENTRLRATLLRHADTITLAEVAADDRCADRCHVAFD